MRAIIKYIIGASDKKCKHKSLGASVAIESYSFNYVVQASDRCIARLYRYTCNASFCSYHIMRASSQQYQTLNLYLVYLSLVTVGRLLSISSRSSKAFSLKSSILYQQGSCLNSYIYGQRS
jgi:hypothetical protein